MLPIPSAFTVALVSESLDCTSSTLDGFLPRSGLHLNWWLVNSHKSPELVDQLVVDSCALLLKESEKA